MKPDFTYFEDFRGYTGSHLPKEFSVGPGFCSYIKGNPDGVLQLFTSSGMNGAGMLQANENFVFRQPLFPRTVTLETRLRMKASGTVAGIQFGVQSTVGLKPVEVKFWCDNQNWRAVVNSGKSPKGKQVVLCPFDFLKEEWTVLRMSLSTKEIGFSVNGQLLARFIPVRQIPARLEDVVYPIPDGSHIWRPSILHMNDSINIMELDLDYLLIEES